MRRLFGRRSHVEPSKAFPQVHASSPGAVFMSTAPVKSSKQEDSTRGTNAGLELNANLPKHSTPRAQPFGYGDRLTGRKIRVLEILSDSTEDNLRCTLQEVNLDSGFYFEALSYAWGSNEKSQSIICNGHLLPVTDSLHDALYHFRKLDLLNPIWVDAVCINQNDLVEKTEQVRMMLSIYKQAQVVRIWLGSKLDMFPRIDVSQAIAVLDRFDDFVSECYAKPDHDRLPYIDFSAVETDKEFSKDMQLVLSLLTTEWFQRVWIVQELLAATRFQCHLGEHKVDPVKALMVAYELRSPLGIGLIMAGKPGRHRFNTPFLQAATLAELKSSYRAGDPMRLSELVKKTARSELTDPRDAVFAMCGIAADVSSSFVDYQKDLRTVYLDLARNALTGSPGKDPEGLTFLSKVHKADADHPLKTTLNLIPDELKTLPSWAPYLRECDVMGRDPLPLVDQYPNSLEACGFGSERCIFGSEIEFGPRESLIVTGKLIDSPKVIAMESPFDLPLQFFENTEKPFECIRQWMQAVEGQVWSNLETPDAPSESLVATRPWYNKLSHCLIPCPIWPHGPNDPPVPRSRYRMCYNALKTYVGIMEHGTHVDAFEAAVSRTNEQWKQLNEDDVEELTLDHLITYADALDKLTRGRKFCITHSKSLCWIPAGAKLGDIFVKLRGLRVPLLLRPNEGSTVSKTGKADGSTFTIVGEAYVDDVMWPECEHRQIPVPSQKIVIT